MNSSDELLITEPTDILVKTIDPVVNGLIALVCFSGVAGLLNFVFGELLIAIPAGAVLAYIATRVLSKNLTTITFEPHSLVITSGSVVFNTHSSKSFELSDIVGYEFYTSKLYNKLVLYRANQSPYCLTLLGYPDATITTFFKSNIKRIDKNNPLSLLSFKQTFKAVLSLLICFWLVQVSVIACYEYFYCEKHHEFWSLSGIHLLYLGLANILIIKIYNRKFDKLKIRIEGKYFGAWMLSLTLIIGLAAMGPIDNIPHYPVSVDRAVDVFNHPKSKIFTINENITIDPSIIGYYEDINKNKRFTRGFITSPILKFPMHKSLWIGTDYMTRKGGHYSSSKIKLLIDSGKKCQFYEVVYTHLHPSIRGRNFFLSATSASHNLYPAIILKPHYEVFEVYRADSFDLVFMYAGICIILIAGGAVVAARCP